MRGMSSKYLNTALNSNDNKSIYKCIEFEFKDFSNYYRNIRRFFKVDHRRNEYRELERIGFLKLNYKLKYGEIPDRA